MIRSSKSSCHEESFTGLKIHFYGRINPLIISDFPIIVEDVCILAAEHVSSCVCQEAEQKASDRKLKNETRLQSLFLSMFGLVNMDHKLWLSCREKLTATRHYHKECFFRIRFRIYDGKLDALADMDPLMLDYFYWQCRDDFLNDRFSSLYGKDVDVSKQLGLMVMDLMIPDSSKQLKKVQGPSDKQSPIQVCITFARNNLSWRGLWKHLPRGLRRKYCCNPWHYIRLYFSLRSELLSDFPKNTWADVTELKKSYIRGVLEYVPNYGTEKYKVMFLKEDGNIGKLEELLVDVYESRPRGVFTVVHGIVQFEHLQNISMTTSGLEKFGGKVHIDESQGLPKIMFFQTKEEADSFVSGVVGFFRHLHDYYNILCKTVEPPSLELVNNLKSYGPMTDEQACTILRAELSVKESKPSLTNSTFFLIHQNDTDLYKFTVLSKIENQEQFEKKHISYKNGMFTLQSEGADPKQFVNAVSLLQELRAAGKQIRPQTGTDSGICEIFKDDLINYYYRAENRQTDKQTREPMFFTDQHISPSDIKHLCYGRYTEVSKAQLCINQKSEDEDVIIKQLKSNNSNLMEAFQEGVSKLMQMKHSLFIRFFGIMVAPPYRVVLEMAPGGSLEKFLINSPHALSLMQIMLVVEQVSQGINWMKDNGLTHGNLRSRNIMVFQDIKSDISVKIGDPGLVSHFSKKSLDDDYNQERLPWIAVELYPDLSKLTPASDIYSFAVLWWELLTKGQRPYADRREKKKPLKDLILAGMRPSCPKALQPDNDFDKKRESFTENAALGNVNKSNVDALSDQQEHNSSGIVMEDNLEEDIKQNIWDFIQKCWTMEDDRPESQEIVRFVLAIYDQVKQLDSEEVEIDWDAILNFNKHMAAFSKPQTHHTDRNNQLIDPKRLEKVENGFLGKGFYGEVMKYKLFDDVEETDERNWKYVAVKKMIKIRGAAKIDFLREISLLQVFEHENIVKVEGVCYQPDVLLVMEFVECGSLKDYIKSRPDLKNDQLIRFCIDVAKGIEYLHSENVVHRDLAARNILVTKNLTAKITDFGLAQTLRAGKDYIRSSDQQFPVHLCPPEALSQAKFTKKGDVWSYGVLMWEVFTRGESPVLVQENSQKIFDKLYKALQENKRLPQKKTILDAVYNIMKKCWTFNMEDRPDITLILSQILHLHMGGQQN